MNLWTQILKYLGVIAAILPVFAGAAAAVAAGQPVTTPPVNTYLEGKHVAISLTISPLS